jgi:signal transduction histidine kinase
MNSAVRAAWFVVLGSALGMLAVLLTIVYRGSRTIESQKASLKTKLQEQIHLRRKNDQLQEKMREALNETARIDDLIHRRVGAELHDGPAQLMTLALVRLDEIKDILHTSNTSSRVVDEVRSVTWEALKELRSIAKGFALLQYRR